MTRKNMNSLEGVDLEPIKPLLADPDVTEVMVNGMYGVYIEKHGHIIKTDVQFEDEDQIEDLIRHIVTPMGRVIDESNPMVDARLPDGSRVNAVLRPVALTGPTLTLRKFKQMDLSWEQLIGFGSVNQKVVDFLRACVRARLNMVMAGGTNAGKTTIMNALSEFIPEDERIVTAETTAELALRHGHVIVLETCPPDRDGKGEITMADLIVNAQRMRADRIISGEVRGGEAWDMLQAMTLGYDGSMFTIHANNARDVLERLETMSTAATNLPLLQIRAKIAQAVELIIQQLRLHDGTRKIVTVTEIVDFKDGQIELRDIFRYETSGEKDGHIIGKALLTGEIPTFADRLDLPDGFFDS
jgi:pilus assembly protein CpaF